MLARGEDGKWTANQYLLHVKAKGSRMYETVHPARHIDMQVVLTELVNRRLEGHQDCRGWDGNDAKLE